MSLPTLPKPLGDVLERLRCFGCMCKVITMSPFEGVSQAFQTGLQTIKKEIFDKKNPQKSLGV